MTTTSMLPQSFTETETVGVFSPDPHPVAVSRKERIPVDGAGRLVELARQLAKADHPATVYRDLAQGLRAALNCTQAAIGRDQRLEALSGVDHFDRRSELAACLETVIAESYHGVAAATEITGRPASATAAQKRLCSLAGVTNVTACPVRDLRGDQVATFVLLGLKSAEDAARAVEALRQAEPHLAACLQLLRPRRRKRRASCRGSKRKWLQRLLQVAPLVALAGATLCLPVPYKIGCDAVVQPAVRRYVAAPYDGRLEKVFVEAGDLVHQDQVLALLDGREIRWELAGLTADRDRARKKRDASLASHDTAAAQIATLEMERLELQIKLLEHRRQILEIRSPIDGIAISGDLKRTEGARLKTGQTLVEIAPLGQMVVEVAIPAEDVSRVVEGQPVEVRFEASALPVRTGTLSRICPRAEVRDAENIFIGEVIFDNPDGLMRPGMKGRARLIGDRHALGWNLFHEAWERLVVFVGW